MYTRCVELTINPDKRKEIEAHLNDFVLPTLRKQPGFTDIVALAKEDDPTNLTTFTFWNSKQDAEAYSRDVFPKLIDGIRSFLKASPSVKTYTVHTATMYRIASGKAA